MPTATMPPVRLKAATVERPPYCINCGLSDRRHVVKTPLGWGTSDGQCLQFVGESNDAMRVSQRDPRNN